MREFFQLNSQLARIGSSASAGPLLRTASLGIMMPSVIVKVLRGTLRDRMHFLLILLSMYFKVQRSFSS